jgi:hypothetical protein
MPPKTTGQRLAALMLVVKAMEQQEAIDPIYSWKLIIVEI